MHIKQHSGLCRSTCMGTMKGDEEENRPREAGVKVLRGSGREKRVDDVKKAQKEAQG